MAGKAKRIDLKGIKPVKDTSPRVCGPSDKSEKKWRAECDARTLSEAAGIYADPERARMARGAASRMLRQDEARLANLRAITKKGLQ